MRGKYGEVGSKVVPQDPNLRVISIDWAIAVVERDEESSVARRDGSDQKLFLNLNDQKCHSD